ncbi:MAG TPA: site-specific integrase [Thermodesulfovibrionales bacterium]|nr:site-specific integrase [Thermodesulfovibrionales bacterium]
MGKEVFKSTGTADLIEAQEIYHMVMTVLLKEAKTHSVNRILGRSVPFPSVVERYLQEFSPSKSKEGRNDKNSSKPLLKFFEEAKIDGISKQDIYKYMDWRIKTVNEKTGKAVSGPSVNRERSFLSKIFKAAIRWGYVNDNPVLGIEGFSENKRERYITDDEFEAILEHLQEDNKEMFLALYHTAQRPGRIYNLQWSQINPDERSITFENTSHNKRVPNVLWINDTLYEILMRRRKNRRTLSPYVFYKPSMKPYSEFDALKVWNKACESAKVKDATPRDLRHKAITDMKKAGHNDSVVGHVVAHSDPRTTKRYTHFSVEETILPLQTLAGKTFLKTVAEK